MSLLPFLAAIALAGPVQDPSLPLDRDRLQAVRDVLFVEGLTLPDLRTGNPLPTGNPWIDSLHESPFPRLLEAVENLGRKASGPFRSRPLAFLRRSLTSLADPPLARRPTTEIRLPDDVPLPLHSPLIRLIRGVLAAHEEVKEALAKLSLDERRELIEGLPRLAVDPSLLQLEFVHRPMASQDALEELVERVDHARIRYAAERLYDEIERTIPDLAASSPPSFRQKLRFSVEGVSIILAGMGDDLHEERDAMLTIDLGGDDRYLGRHGAGIGYGSALIDLGGDDTYVVPDASLGVGILGIGLAWDLGGRDVVRGRSICLGAGIAGVGVFRSAGEPSGANREPGEDSGDELRSVAMSQGFGMRGIGALVRSGLADQYRSSYLSQGAALDGGVGAMLDLSGTDLYHSEGLAPSLESDWILRSRSQGFGARGGIGLLLSSAEASQHVAGTESQGCGIDGGFGMTTASGSSRFRIEGYGQGFGGESGIGILAGGTEFVCGGGGAHGTGIESGIGLLIGSFGNDLYVSSAGRPGTGTRGGLGMLLDFGGSDTYSSGASFASRELSDFGTGLMIDWGGPNAHSVVRGSPSVRSTEAVSIVGELEAKTPTEAPEEPSAGTAATLLEAAIGRAFAEASGEADHANRSVRLRSRRSLASSLPALTAWIERSRRPLHSREVDLLGVLFEGGPPDVVARIRRLAASNDPLAARNAIRILASAKVAEAKDEVLAALKRDQTDDVAARAAFDLGLAAAIPDLMALAGSGSANARRWAALALAEWGGADALPTSQALLGSPDPMVRAAAVRHYGRLAPASIDPLKTLTSSANETAARGAMRALGAIGSIEALEFLASKLADNRPHIRIEALKALAGRCPRDHRPAFEARRADSDNRVRLAAAALDPGR